MPDDLKIIYYPDPRLKKMSQPVTKFDAGLRELVVQMLRLMGALIRIPTQLASSNA